MDLAGLCRLLDYHWFDFAVLNIRKVVDSETIGVNATSWTAASSLLALGLSVGQAMGVIVGASLFAGILAVVAGWMGSHHYVGFTILSRAYAIAACVTKLEADRAS